MENYLCCCSESCNDWLSSIGSALGYEAYIEGVVAVVVIRGYLLVFKAERQRLGLISLRGVADIAFEKQEDGSTGVAAPVPAAPASGAADAGTAKGLSSKANHTVHTLNVGPQSVDAAGSVFGRSEAQLPQVPGGRRGSAAAVSVWQE